MRASSIVAPRVRRLISATRVRHSCLLEIGDREISPQRKWRPESMSLRGAPIQSRRLCRRDGFVTTQKKSVTSHESRLPIMNLLFALVRSCDDLIARSLKIDEKVLCSARRQLLSEMRKQCRLGSSQPSGDSQRKRALLASEETRFQTKLFASAEAPPSSPHCPIRKLCSRAAHTSPHRHRCRLSVWAR